MAELSHLTRSKPTQVQIDLGEGDYVSITFDRNKVTPHWAREAQKRDDERDVESMPKALAEVILSWDVTDDGQQLEPTPEKIALLSFPAQSALMGRIMEAAVPSSEEGNGSSDISATPVTPSTEPPASLQNGPQPSPSPEPSASPSPT